MHSNAQQKSKKSSAADKKLEALRAKQEKRKFKGASILDPSLDISLDEFTSFTAHLKFSKRVFALLGAGLSVSSGMATFRGSDRHWRGHEPSDLSDIGAFATDPATVWWFFSHRMMKAQNATPNPGHLALAKLAESNSQFFAVNQNIDGLCKRAGFPQSQIAQVHGDLFSVKCSKHQSSKNPCSYVADVTYPISQALTLPAYIDISDPNDPLPKLSHTDLPHCPKCNSLLRPNVVLFGEATSLETTKRIYEFTSGGPIDLMLVVGTSAVVLPAAMYIPIARNTGARIAFFNLEESDEEAGRVWSVDWYFKGDAAVTVAELLKGVVGTVRGTKLAINHASKIEA
ncbi:NAD-dependent deacetylase sirtuin-5 [Melanomma pulvis-pyrius CBS 109.77]|uniref:NAD-dependent deacetylase sirtuin-5 n=1 Tax=Melanomma pulvis-pyrius CBS 109.77 TaxID=1314802 RepID=A0A6A6XRD0_9PLEO|nr:NAD-dependent deacetylase sirtuin-5 [Melanomma pulvis-pyrius CBS 109.77]